MSSLTLICDVMKSVKINIPGILDSICLSYIGCFVEKIPGVLGHLLERDCAILRRAQKNDVSNSWTKSGNLFQGLGHWSHAK
jgi:hypothetical protein